MAGWRHGRLEVRRALAAPAGGARPGLARHPAYGGTALDCLLHSNDDHHDNLLSRRWVAQDGLGEGLVPFALDIGGDLYCFDYRAGAEAPQGVGYWSAGTGYLPLADDFAGFLGLLFDRRAR